MARQLEIDSLPGDNGTQATHIGQCHQEGTQTNKPAKRDSRVCPLFPQYIMLLRPSLEHKI